MKKTLGLSAILALSSLPAMAAAPAYVEDITTGIDDAKTAGLAIIAALAAVLVVKITWRVVKGFRS